MDCTTAQRLIDNGIAPGTGDPLRSQLGFHLSHCAACRAYQRRDEPLLATLLENVPAARTVPVVMRSRPHRRRGVWLVVGGLFLALLAWMLTPPVMALLTIRDNLAAMGDGGATRVEVASGDGEDRASPAPTARGAIMVPTAGGEPTAGGRVRVGIGGGDEEDGASPVPTEVTVVPTGVTAVPTAGPQFLAPRAAVAPTPLPLPTPLPTATPPLPPLLPNPDTITILLLGIDRRPDEGGPSRSDAIAVVHIDLSLQRVAILSLPRDLIVAIPEIGNARINSAMVYGELNPELGGGMELARRTVENLLNVPIDDVVEVDFMGFIAAVDSLGGVMVNVEQPLYDATYPTMDYGYQTVAFAPGLQYMDGATALIYGRIRHSDSDFERMKRQQSIMLAMVEQVRGQHMLQQLQSMASLTSALRGYVRTTMSEERMISLAWELRNIDLSTVERYTLTRAQTASGQLAEDPFALFALPGVIDDLSHKLVGE